MAQFTYKAGKYLIITRTGHRIETFLKASQAKVFYEMLGFHALDVKSIEPIK